MSSSRGSYSQGSSRGGNPQGPPRRDNSQSSSQSNQSIMSSNVASGNTTASTTAFTLTKEEGAAFILWLERMIEETGRELVQARGVDPRNAKGMRVTIFKSAGIANLEWSVTDPKTQTTTVHREYGATSGEFCEAKVRVALFGKVKELVMAERMKRKG